MNAPIPLISTLAFAGLLLFTSCEKATEPDVPQASEPVVEEPVAKLNPEAAALEALSDDDVEEELLSLIEDGDVSASDLELLSKNLSSDEQETLKAALEKAVGELDLSLLQTSLEGALGNGGASIKGGAVKVLTPEEAKKMGIDIEALTGGAENIDIRALSSVLTNGAGGEIPEGAEIIHTETVTIEAVPVEGATADDGERFNKLLKSGNSDALAKELSSMIQTGLDAAALQQLGVEGGSKEVPAEASEGKKSEGK